MNLLFNFPFSQSAESSAPPMEQVATPSISPATDIYTEPFEITISCEIEGVDIYYTLDGNEPTEFSSVYYDSGKPYLESNGEFTVKAKAFKGGYTPSETATTTYTLEISYAAPYFGETSGNTYYSPTGFSIFTYVTSGTIFYKIGNTPISEEVSNSDYHGSFAIQDFGGGIGYSTGNIQLEYPQYYNQDVYIKAIYYDDNEVPSQYGLWYGTISIAPITSPSFTTGDPIIVSDYETGYVYIDNLSYGTVYYELSQGGTPSDPTEFSTTYSGYIALDEITGSVSGSTTYNLKAIAIAPGYPPSDIASTSYHVQTKFTTPTISSPITVQTDGTNGLIFTGVVSLDPFYVGYKLRFSYYDDSGVNAFSTDFSINGENFDLYFNGLAFVIVPEPNNESVNYTLEITIVNNSGPNPPWNSDSIFANGTVLPP